MEIILREFDKDLITDAIHDRFFDIESIGLNQDAGILEIDYFPNFRRPSKEGKLTIKHVIKVDIIDRNKIQHYDFNYIKWCGEERKLKIITNVPLVFEITVSEFHMEIEMNP